ncbi:OmpA family protein [Defluviimonas sp. WL0024]|uniref:OmpA family protein n=2 Tax=Albidovulum TaxID=205889 RepID=A0ABT3J4V5_9RHOB|nr:MULTISPECIES: OmpA family protein [Defluviimonas]MCU9849157.1 OmpA family protein [Defluviimonas sp. WL0024]MCW3782717.1 OmpA family protein [Defluviimonas salinarum]
MRFTTLLTGGTAAAILLAACTPVDQYNPNDPNQRTRQGALTGAGVGALAGALTGEGGIDKRDRAIVGAVAGGLIGGMVGSNLDQQAAELDRAIVNDRVRVINEGNQLRVIMPEGILFAVDSASVNPGIIGDLYAVADNLNRHPDSRVEVIGHTDNTGAAAYNFDLSQRRASAVGAIIRDGGVAPGRIAAFGQGENQPVASNLTPEGRAQNRRVEILIIPTR